MAGVKGKILKTLLVSGTDSLYIWMFSALVGLAFTGSIGLMFLFLACALPQFKYEREREMVWF